MTKILACLMTAAALLCAASARAADEPAGDEAKNSKSQEKKAEPKPEQSVTRHSVTIGGKAIAYTATAGTLIVRNAKDEPTAAVGYTAYVRDGADPGRRPITFAYNGGPGSSSIWLHLGALGPRRIVTADARPTPPAPYRLVDNAYSVLDKTDLVMIDPVGTGLSRAVGSAKDKDFWGVDPDIESVSRFIEQYVSDNGRWNSPKYLLGESYGTARSAGVVDYLQTRENMAFNGVILVSVALDVEAIFVWPGNDRPYAFLVPTFAAVAAYHHALPHPPAQLGPFLDEARRFALGEYSAALLKGDSLSDQERDAVAEKLHELTGLSVDFIKKSKLRVRESLFTQELLREHHATVGRLDARFTGVTFDLLAEDSEYDPQDAAISAAFTAAFLDYYHRELKFGQGKTYNVQNLEANEAWEWKHRIRGFGQLPFPGVGPNLAHALGFNPNLRVLVVNGTYDLATPFLATESMIDHLGLEKDLRSHIQSKYYEAGHMMYVHEPSLQQLKGDLAAFYDSTSASSRLPGE
ncbi:MAG TPA: peptidase S10 [Thermoanaerobaculia bacterium]|nr:peptidase S10 [Thermoanaerobaculia bacterium]